jgi:DNA repair protein RecO
MHHIHRTKGIIIKSIPVRESDKQITILTENFGVLKILAQGSRKIESKFRQSIQDFSLVTIATVRGKSGWRLTNVLFLENFYNEIQNQELKESIIRVLNFIDRLVVGESDEHLEIFEITNKFINFAKNNENSFDKVLIKNFEIIFLMRILVDLGYIDMSDHVEFLEDISVDSIKKVNQDVLEKVNQGIRESGL